MKSYTSIEQSKTLAEFLPLESADMCWTSFDEKWDAYLGSPNPEAIKKEIPCWSLAALLSILPKDYSLGNKKGKYYICMTHIKHDVTECDNPVDACYEMIIKLRGLNLL